MTLDFIDAIGVAGSLAVCTAYVLVSRGKLDATGFPYHFLNLVGAGMLLFSLYFEPNVGAIVIEAVWASIAAISILALLLRRRGDR